MWSAPEHKLLTTHHNPRALGGFVVVNIHHKLTENCLRHDSWCGFGHIMQHAADIEMLQSFEGRLQCWAGHPVNNEFAIVYPLHAWLDMIWLNKMWIYSGVTIPFFISKIEIQGCSLACWCMCWLHVGYFSRCSHFSHVFYGEHWFWRKKEINDLIGARVKSYIDLQMQRCGRPRTTNHCTTGMCKFHQFSNKIFVPTFPMKQGLVLKSRVLVSSK